MWEIRFISCGYDVGLARSGDRLWKGGEAEAVETRRREGSDGRPRGDFRGGWIFACASVG